MSNLAPIESAPSSTDLEQLVGELEQRNVARQTHLQEAQRGLEERARALRERTTLLRGMIDELVRSQPDDAAVELQREMSSLVAPRMEESTYRLAMLHERRQAAMSRGLTLETLAETLNDFDSALHMVTARLDCAAQELQDQGHDAAGATQDATSAGADLRRAYRVKVNAAVTMESDSNVFTGFSVDLSDAGVFVATAEILAPGERVQIAVNLPSGQRIEALGEVRWVREYNDATPLVFPGMGIQFVNLNSQHKAALRAFLAHREPMFYAD